MSFIEKLQSDTGRIILSIIWGLGLAMLFRRVCKGRNCIIIKGPSPSEMDGKIYKFNDKCYKYSSETTQCMPNKVY